MGEINHVTVGLPSEIAHLISWVDIEYQTHPLSWTPGGSEVVVQYRDGRKKGYRRIKDPLKYIRTFFPGHIEFLPDRMSQLRSLKEIVSRIFLRTYKDQKDYFTSPFHETWNSETSLHLPWEERTSDWNDDDGFFDELADMHGYDESLGHSRGDFLDTLGIFKD